MSRLLQDTESRFQKEFSNLLYSLPELFFFLRLRTIGAFLPPESSASLLSSDLGPGSESFSSEKFKSPLSAGLFRVFQ